MTEYLDEFCRLANLENLDYVARQIAHYKLNKRIYRSIFNNIARKHLNEVILVTKKYNIDLSDISSRNYSKKLRNSRPYHYQGRFNIVFIREMIKYSKENPNLHKLFSMFIITMQISDTYIIIYFIKTNIIHDNISKILDMNKNKKFVSEMIFISIMNDYITLYKIDTKIYKYIND